MPQFFPDLVIPSNDAGVDSGLPIGGGLPPGYVSSSQFKVLPLQEMVSVVIKSSASQCLREERTSLQIVLISPRFPSPRSARRLRKSWGALWPMERVSAVLAEAAVAMAVSLIEEEFEAILKVWSSSSMLGSPRPPVLVGE